MKPHISGKEATYVPLEAAKRGPMRVGAVTAARQAAVAATGKTPLDVMLANMRWADKGAADLQSKLAEREAPPDPHRLALLQELLRLRQISQQCAKHAAPYVHPVVADDPEALKGTLKRIGGSQSDHWNDVLVNQTVQALWINHSDKDTRDLQYSATVAALIGIGPKDEIEGMIAAQLLAAHNAAMECYRRAMLGEQTFEGRRENLSQANKLSRTYAVLLDALNRHRGKGQQKVTVEHVHVHSGGQAIVGTVETPGLAKTSKPERQHNAKQIADARQPAMWSADAEREPVPITGDAERPMSNARRNVAGSTEGK
jgi:hypothetical protein